MRIVGLLLVGVDVVGQPAVGRQLSSLLLDDGRGASGSASSAGEGINDLIVDE